MDKATLGVYTHHTERGVTETDSRRDNTITIKKRLKGDADSTIAKELHGGDGVLVQGLQQLRKDGRRTSRLIDSRWKTCHQISTAVHLERHGEVKHKSGDPKRIGDPRLN